MDDTELIRELGLLEDEGKRYLARISVAKRAMLVRLIETARALNRGERPEGVIVCRSG